MPDWTIVPKLGFLPGRGLDSITLFVRQSGVSAAGPIEYRMMATTFRCLLENSMILAATGGRPTETK
jgi:hypothetical protein